MRARKFLDERRQKKQAQTGALLLMMAGGAVLVIGTLVFAIINSNRVNLSPRQITIPEFSQASPGVGTGLGDPEAPVVIEEFSDFGCTHCADFALETKRSLEEAYIETGQVYLVFHSVGGLLNSPATFQAAEAAYCASDQDAFWPFHDLVFANQARLFASRTADISRTMKTFAEILELDVDEFADCLSEGKHRSRAAADQELAVQSGVSGTPSFLINGVLLVGNQPFENFQMAIEGELGKAAK